ncbi:Protein DJ- B [Ananas comosus]|uniref:Protein DJ-B n=1 Tax=Ananas comosus TaxID=4615 RepID=A0A199W2D8_ANACO|nr:Protein DJ- B [Ananas comosus]
MEAVIIIDVLRRSGADVTVASVEKDLRVDACWGVKLVADALVADCAGSAFDLISLPVRVDSGFWKSDFSSDRVDFGSGGMPGAANFGIVYGEEARRERRALFCDMCGAGRGPGIMGPAQGLKATCYPSSWISFLRHCCGGIKSTSDGKAVTSRGAGTAVEFSLVLIEHLYGKDKAAEVAGPLVMRPHHGVEFTMKELNRVEWKFNGTPNILVPIANGSEEMEAVMIIDILRRAKANVTVASVEDKLEIVASRKVKIVADTLLHDASKQQYDLIVLPGGLGGAKAFANSETLINLLKKQAGSNQLYGAICASPAIALEPHGLLKGKKATAFPPMCDKLSDQSECENRVVVDGNLITSRGPGTAMEFSLVIVEKFFGREKALDLAKSLVFM